MGGGHFNSKIKAFTLIELLAIIVILAIIAVITVPIILNVIDNARKGSAIDSAYGYKEAVKKSFLGQLAVDSNMVLPTGTFVLGEDNKLEGDGEFIVNVSGTIPDIGSWIELRKGEVVAFSLKIGDYIVTKYENEDISAIKGTEVADNPVIRELKQAKEQALTVVDSIISSSSVTTGIIETEDGWVALLNGELVGYSVKTSNNYVVTKHNSDTNPSGAKNGTLASSEADLVYIVKAQVSSYLTLVSNDTTVQALTEDTVLKVSDITGVAKLSEMDDNSWIRFAYDSSVSISDCSIKLGDYIVDYSSTESDNMTVTKNGTLRRKPLMISSTIGAAVTNFGGYDWHVIGVDNTANTVTLLMDAGKNGNYKLPSDTNLTKDDTNKVSKMAHCTTGSTSNCTWNGSYYVYSWDKSLIKDYLNGTFLTSLESQIGNDVINPVTVCNDPSRGDGGATYGGYLVSEIPEGKSCSSTSSNYKVRLISYNEYNSIKNNSAITDKNTWFHSSSIGIWWSMVSSSGSSSYYVKDARSVYVNGSWNYSNGEAASGVRAVITISR